ncbi:MAG: hypothetical protein L3J39_00335 [Verrucomicrobiales bacterium]|nr:hypothetical protein [Verrucomicrobiales bacterium]
MEANTLYTNFPEHRQVRRYRHLIKALLCSVVIHVLALVAMALILAPGLDTEAAVISRATWVAEHPYWWRLGWLPWQLTALSDLWVSAALLAYLWSVPGRPGFAYACFGMFWVIVAVIPDQCGEAVFVSHFVTLAKSTAEGDTALSTYLKVESWGLRVTGVWGAGAYVLMSMGWFMASLKSAGGVRMHRFFAVIALVTVGLFSLAAGLTWYATSHAQVEQGYPLFAYVYRLNALAFPLLLLVMMGMICVLAWGHYHRLPAVDTKRHRLGFPNEGRLLRYFSSYIAGLRDCLRWLPSPHLCSDISDVGIYPEVKQARFHTENGKDLSRAVLKVLKRYGYTTKKVIFTCKPLNKMI